MSVSYSQFQQEVALQVLKFRYYSTVTNPTPPAAVNAELTTLGTALATDTTTHGKTIEHPPAALVVGGAGHSAFTTLMNIQINKAKAGNLSNATIAAAIDGVAGVLFKPGNIDVPYASANASPPIVGTVCSVTQGNWAGTPSSYAYAWYRNGVAIGGATAATYTLVSADTGGKQITAIVTATNATGSTAAPPSNAIAVP